MSTYYTLACEERRVRIELPGGPDYWLGCLEVAADAFVGDPITADMLRAASEEYLVGADAKRPWLSRRVERLIAAMGDGAWRVYCDAGYGCVDPSLREYEEIGDLPDGTYFGAIDAGGL